ncbi:hypothetical protein PIB30_066951 [Stylosanthes scabra]|uniref:Uncharacterized protein n=1 Tax=Stylosanthes scabra TaxID=79078 RepID=A0ABU6RMU0_9FABA|nr:hypothetical protein [Stylosanthes scabra]
MDFDASVVDCLNQTIDEDPEEVLRDSTNASEEIQQEQVPLPLKSVVEECVIEDNDEAVIRPNKTYLALSNEVGGSSNLNFLEKDVCLKTDICGFLYTSKMSFGMEQKELEDDVADSKGVLHCVSSSLIELQFQQEYTSDMFKDVQEQFLKKADCIVKVISKEGEMHSLLVGQQKLISDNPVVDTYRVSFDLVV